MNRRRLLMLLAGTAAMWHRAGHAQQIPRFPRVGVLHQTSSTEAKQAAREFREGMRALGWIDGSTVAIEDHFANGDASLLASNAVGLVAAKVDVIVAFSGVPARAAREATSAIPIVMDVGDAVGSGLVASLAHPGGNVTGQSLMRPDMAAKQLQLFREVVPQLRTIGVLLQSDYKVHQQQMAELERAGAGLGIPVLAVPVGTAQDLPRRFDEMTAAGVDGYLVLNEPRTDALRGDLIELASRHRQPVAAQERRWAEAGALFCYGVNLDVIHRRAAYFVDKILKGARPADLPVEQPTTFELIVNLKTAKTLGLAVPPSLLAHADKVIE